MRRLEKQGLLASSWDTAENRPRRYYSLTPEGKTIRTLLLAEWNGIDSAVWSIIKKEGEDIRKELRSLLMDQIEGQYGANPAEDKVRETIAAFGSPS